MCAHSPAILPSGDARKAWRRICGLAPGLALVAVLALAALWIGRIGWLQAKGINALTLAILLGMLVGNTVYPRLTRASAAGVTFSKQSLLRLGIVLYGLRLTPQEIGHVGMAGVIIDAGVLCSTFALACFAGTRFLGLDRKSAMLIGAGSSICGAAAVLATEPVVRGRPEHVTVAVSTVVVFGTMAVFLYPMFYHLNVQYQFIRMSSNAYGIFMGSTIHEVAQVMAAGNAVGADAGKAAVVAKMVRVMMLAPFLIVLSACLSRAGETIATVPDAATPPRERSRIMIPWFALAFVAVAGLNSMSLLPRAAVNVALDIDTVLLTMAMSALGLSTHASAIRNAGVKPLVLGALLFGVIRLLSG